MQKILLLLAVAATLGSCQKDDTKPEEDLASLKEQFHGKYKIVSATSNIAVDLDEDGRATANLMEEIPDLANSYFVVLVGGSYVKQGYVGLLDQSWQTQYFTHVKNQAGRDSVQMRGFFNAITPRWFNFSADRTQLTVEQLAELPSENGQYPAPESIAVTSPEQLVVVTNRRLFVRRAWTQVRVTVLYKRFTKTT